MSGAQEALRFLFFTPTDAPYNGHGKDKPRSLTEAHKAPVRIKKPCQNKFNRISPQG